MMRTLYDSIHPDAIPADAEMVAGYVDGRYAWTAAQWARFTTRHKLGITVTGAEITTIADVESGDMTPAHVPGWIADRKKAEAPHRATVYCNRDSLAAVKAACQGAGFNLGHDYVIWLATLDGTIEVPDMTGIVAVQDKGSAASGGDYDTSIVYADDWYGDAKPADPPIPAEEKGELSQIRDKVAQIGQLVDEIGALASQ